MKFSISLFLLVVIAMVAVNAYEGRYRRSPKDKNGQISISGKREGGKTSWNVEGQQKVWGNKHGSVHVSGGASKQPGGKPQGHIGIGGSIKWR